MTEAVAKKKVPRRKDLTQPSPSQGEGGHAVRVRFAVFATGGKQYRVSEGDLVKIEKLPGDHKEGETLTFDSVLMTDNGAAEITLGNPFIKGSYVSATLNKIGRYKTIDVIKYKQKSRYFKKYGHRQPYFEVKIDSIK